MFLKEETRKDSGGPRSASIDPDDKLPPTLTSTDYWEHMFLAEREKRRAVQKQFGADCSDDEVEAGVESTGDDTVAAALMAATGDDATDSGGMFISSPNDQETERERRGSLRRDRKLSVDDFPEWNSCLNEAELSGKKLEASDATGAPEMISIDASDDEAAEEPPQWWKGDGFKTELRSRSHRDIADVSVNDYFVHRAFVLLH